MEGGDVETQIENFELKFENFLMVANVDQLVELGEALNIVGVEKEMRKTKIMKTFREFLYTNWGETSEENLPYIKHFVEAFKVILEPKQVAEKPLLVGNETEVSAPTGATSKPAELVSLLQSLSVPRETSLFKRSLKILGTIGDSKDKNCINYINLCSQVNDAKSTGYSDSEIARAVKKAILPNSYLRTYFDTEVNIDLNRMLAMLRDFFREKSSSELFSDLSTLCQSAQEKATDFLLRAFEQKAKVISASRAEGNLYDTKLVHGTFCRTVKTGLRDGSIRAHMRPFLEPTSADSTKDELLLREINLASRECDERTTKQKTATLKTIHINQASTPDQASSSNSIPESSTASSEINSAIKPLMDGLYQLQQQMKSMQDQRNKRQSSSNSFPKLMRCKECKDKNIYKCTHCFKCGSESHQAKDCSLN